MIIISLTMIINKLIHINSLDYFIITLRDLINFINNHFHLILSFSFRYLSTF